jgi:phosphoribosylformimino-5-aminoimidazole carboxamide ribonucleotide (ProFAR) isomerase
VIYTEIARDGMGSGYDLDALAHVAGLSSMHVTASGGAKSLDDLRALADRTPENVDHAIVGRALYEGTLDLRAALAALAT